MERCPRWQVDHIISPARYLQAYARGHDTSSCCRRPRRHRDQADGTGAIRHIHDRTNKLSRRAPGRRSDREHIIAANIDHVWVIQSVERPRFNNGFVDRLIVIAESEHIPVGLVINKVDLVSTEAREQMVAEWKSLYQRLEYPVLLTSATKRIGIEDFKYLVTDRISLVFGPSGAGKSSLLNAMAPELELPVGDVSDKTRKGRHTTSFARLWPIGSGYVIDTPGIRELGLWEFHPSDLSGFFVEMQPLRDHCRFPNCVHDHEPGCAIRDAVEQGVIHQERYASYLRILASLSDED
jgi:ribosome biogenesis GTPase